jgi:hypothetical protein
MSASLFAGTWIFDSELSRLNSTPPLKWIQRVKTNDGRLQVEEEITRSAETIKVEVDAFPDGTFYPVTGSPIADEISYVMEGQSIIGLGRKNGAVSLREIINFPEPQTMTMTMTLVMNGKEISLGTASFRQAKLQ